MSSEGGLAILGAGIFAKEAHLPALAKLGSSAPPVKAIYSRSEKSAADLASAAQFTLRLSSAPDVYFDDSPHNTLDALLSRPDISTVLVLLPITLQPSIVLKSLAAGKHVISEKPVAPDVASGRALIEEYEAKYKSKGLVWRVAENWEAEPGYRRIGEMIREGKIGRVVFFKSIVVNYIDRNSKWYKTPWRTVPDYQGGFLLDGGVHTIAALRTLLPGPPTHLTGFSSLTKSYLMPHDTIHSVLKREPSTSNSTPSTDADGNTITDGYHGIQEITFAHPTPSKPTIDAYVITGTKGYVTVRNVDGGLQAVFTWLVKEKGQDGNEVEKEQSETHTFPTAGIEVELKSFFDEVKGQGDGVGFGDPWNALFDVAVIQAALNSGGELVDLRELVKSG